MKIYKLKAKSSENETRYNIDTQSQDYTKLVNLSTKAHSTMNDQLHITCKPIQSNKKLDLNNISYIDANSVSNIVIDETALEFFSENRFGQLEFIPINSDDRTLYLLYVRNVVDAYRLGKMQYNTQKIPTTDENGNDKTLELIGHIYTYAFYENKLNGNDIFRCKRNNYYNSDVFVTEEFKMIVEKSGLSGFQFIETLNQ